MTQTQSRIAIGGLISEEDRKAVSGLPILMDIPIIGTLFRKTTTTKARTEIVIFLTARVIDGNAAGATSKSATGSPVKKN